MNSGQRMTKLSDMLYISFPIPSDVLDTINIRACITGHVGSGKTSFINKMCNKNHSTGCKIYTITKDILYEDSVYQNNSRFRFYDTPGYDSQEEAFRHALALRATLTKIPYNIILIQVSFQTRFHKITKKIKDQIQIFKGYQNYVVFMVSQFDICPEKDKANCLQQFEKYLQTFELKFRFILYSNVSTDFQILSKLLYNIAARNQPRLIQIDDDKFYQYFNLSSSTETLKLQKIKPYIIQIQKQCKYLMSYIKQIKKNKEAIQDIDELISDFKIFMKFYLKACQDEQYKIYEKQFEENVVVDIYLISSKIIHSKLEEVDQITDNFLKKTYYDQYYKKEFDIRDMFKQCPNCGLIWMKAEGCNGATNCGNKPNYWDYIKNRDIYRYQFILENGKVISKKNDSFGKVKQKRINNTQQKGEGCGYKLDWQKLPRIENIDQIIKRIYGINNFNQKIFDIQKLKKQHAKFKAEIQAHNRKTNKVIQEDKLKINYIDENGQESEKFQRIKLQCPTM